MTAPDDDLEGAPFDEELDEDEDFDDEDYDDEFDDDELDLFAGERDAEWYRRVALAQLAPEPRWFVPVGDDEFANELPDQLRLLVGAAVIGLREALLTEDEVVRRLYPTAYPDDKAKNDEFAALAHDQLLMARLDGLDIVERTLDAETLSSSELNAWLQSVNEARLVLGTQLDVGEGDPREYDLEDPHAPQLYAYRLLARILGDLVSTLNNTLPPPSGAEPPADPEHPE